MGPKASSTNNRYILTVVDEYSRFPFAFPCPDMNADTVIKCLESLFSLCGNPEALHSDRGSQFMSNEVKEFLLRRHIAQSRTFPYNPAGNGQCEKYNGLIWKACLLSLKSHSLKETQWERVLPEALHSLRSLLCTSTNCTPHERFFLHSRLSTLGPSIPTWLMEARSVYVKRHVRHNKSDPLVDKADVIQVNPQYVVVRFPNGRESSISLRDVSPCVPEEATENNFDDLISSESEDVRPAEDLEEKTDNEGNVVRRSNRISKPPCRMDL